MQIIGYSATEEPRWWSYNPMEEEEEEEEDWTTEYANELKYALSVFPWQSIDNVSFISEKEVEFVDGDICYIPVGFVH